MTQSIGVVDVRRLLDDSKHGKILAQGGKSLAEKWQKELNSAAANLSAMQQHAQSQPAKTPADQQRMQLDLRIAELELRHAQELSRAEVEGYRERARHALLQAVNPVLADLAKEKNLAAVFNIPSNELAYADTRLDITSDLIARADKLPPITM